MLGLHIMSATAALFPIGQVKSLRVDHWVHNMYITGDMDKEFWLNVGVKVCSLSAVGSKENMGQRIEDKKHSLVFFVILWKRRRDK